MSAAPRRLLLLGGTQFIGRAAVEALLLTGEYELTLFNRARTPHPFGGRVCQICGDRQDCRAVWAALTSQPAWHAVIDFIAFEPEDVEPIIAHRATIGLYIVISTDSVYMACSPKGFVRDGVSQGLLEDSAAMYDATRARKDRYGEGKLLLERELEATTDLDWIALRLPDVLGPHENTGRQHSLLTKLIRGRAIGTRNGDMYSDGTGSHSTAGPSSDPGTLGPQVADHLASPAMVSFAFDFERDAGASTTSLGCGKRPGNRSEADTACAESISKETLMTLDSKDRRVSIVFSRDVAESIVAVLAAPRDELFQKCRASCTKCDYSIRGALSAQSDGRGLLNGSKSQESLHPMGHPSRGVSLHICQQEAPTWAQLVQSFADALREAEVDVPEVQLDPLRDTRFLSVDCGHLDGGRACRALVQWQPAPLLQRVRETVHWWLGQMRLDFASKAKKGELKAACNGTSSALRTRTKATQKRKTLPR